VFDVSFGEMLVFGVVALLVLGPDRLPGMLRLTGQWIARARRLMLNVRHQSGIDEVLRAEGFGGGLGDIRAMMHGGAASLAPTHMQPLATDAPAFDRDREYPVEGPDAYGALPEDLVAVAPMTVASDLAPAEATAAALANGNPPSPRI